MSDSSAHEISPKSHDADAVNMPDRSSASPTSWPSYCCDEVKPEQPSIGGGSPAPLSVSWLPLTVPDANVCPFDTAWMRQPVCTIEKSDAPLSLIGIAPTALLQLPLVLLVPE